MTTPDPAVLFVVAPNWLGDAVMALPAIGDLRRYFGGVELVIVARPSVAPLFEMVPGVDRVLNTMTGLADLHGPDLPTAGILFPNSFGSAWRLRKAGVPERWGYAHEFRSPLLTRAVTRPRASMHQGRYYQHLVAQLGIANGPLEPAIDVPDVARSQVRERLMAAGWDGQQPLVTLAPGAAYGTAKRWLPRHFARVIATLARTHQARAVLVGSAADAETIRLIASEPSVGTAAPIDLVGTTSLQELAAIIAVSAACVSNDSGAMHLAGAIGTPVVALFGPTREMETAPLTRAGGRAHVLLNPVWCRPCMLRECPIDHRCMRGLDPARVIETVAGVLA